MELINEKLFGEDLRLEANMAGWQQLYWNNQLVSARSASADTNDQILHEFELESDQGTVQCQLQLQLTWHPFSLNYQITANDQSVSSGSRSVDDLGQSTPAQALPMRRQFSIMSLLSLGLKLLKSAKAVKVLLVGASVAAYSWLFSIQFALLIILCLVIHEYGHIRAMKYFGMKTKGIYLIPFVGGAAVGESNLNTRWQNVVISIMGPVFGGYYLFNAQYRRAYSVYWGNSSWCCYQLLFWSGVTLVFAADRQLRNFTGMALSATQRPVASGPIRADLFRSMVSVNHWYSCRYHIFTGHQW